MYDWPKAAENRPRQDYGPRPEIAWQRCTKTRPCPICGKPDWCSIAEDGTVACCMRVADGAAVHKDLGHGVGYIHRLAETTDWTWTPRPKSVRPRRLPLAYDRILARWRDGTSQTAFEAFASILGVSAASLDRLGAAFAPEKNAWAFPMHDARRQVIGIRLRTETAKFALNGSAAGLFIPAGLDSRSTLLICEGPTDTAAALTLGFHAVGRPSCSGGTAILQDMLQAGRRRPVVIMADADGPGLTGARQLADRIVGLAGGVRIITAAPHKDLRAWVQAGATATEVLRRIEASGVVPSPEVLAVVRKLRKGRTST